MKVEKKVAGKVGMMVEWRELKKGLMLVVNLVVSLAVNLVEERDAHWVAQ